MTHAFHTNARKQLTPQQKAKLFLERGGRCHRCMRKLRTADVWIVEHLRALENGGTNDWENLTITCAWCFPKKNKDDDAIAKKTRHVATKHVVPTKERKSQRGFKGWRKFDGTPVFSKERR